jgi:hypothetical protein
MTLLAGSELRVGLRRTVLLLLLVLLLLVVRVLLLCLYLGRKGILAARELLLRRVQPHRGRGQRWIRVSHFMLVWRLRSLLIEGLRWRRLLLLVLMLRRQRSSIRARRGSMLERRRREAASLAALVLTRRPTRPGVVVEHVAEVHDCGANGSKDDFGVSCVLLACRTGLYTCGATTRTRWKDLITHPGHGDASCVCDSGKNGNSSMVYCTRMGRKQLS